MEILPNDCCVAEPDTDRAGIFVAEPDTDRAGIFVVEPDTDKAGIFVAEPDTNRAGIFVVFGYPKPFFLNKDRRVGSNVVFLKVLARTGIFLGFNANTVLCATLPF